SPSLRAQAKQSISPQHFPVIASASEAIHLSAKTSMDCFVAEFIIGPAEGGTRWLLAMTIITIRLSLQGRRISEIQKISLANVPKSLLNPMRPVSTRGAFRASSRTRGGMRWTRQRQAMSGDGRAGRQGP